LKIKCKAKDLQDEITKAFPRQEQDEVDSIERIEQIKKKLIQRKLRRDRGSAPV